MSNCLSYNKKMMEEQTPKLSPKKEPEEIKTEEAEEPEQKQEPEEPKQQATVIMRPHVITATGTLVQRDEQPRETEQEIVQNPSPQELEQFEHSQQQYIVTTEGSFQQNAQEYQEQFQTIEIPESQIQHITIQPPQYIDLQSVNSSEIPSDFPENSIQQYLLSYNGRTEENGTVLKDAVYQNFEISQPGNMTLMGENGTTTNIFYNPVSQYPPPTETYSYPSTSLMASSPEVYPQYAYSNHGIESYENGVGEMKQCVLCGRALSGNEYKDNMGNPLCGSCFNSRRGHPVRSPKKQPMVNTRRNNVQCANCKTTNTTLWRRNNSGEPVCNACGLYYKLHNVNRPQSMKKEGIQTRKRKPKNSSQGHSMNGMAHGTRIMMNPYPANEISSPIIEHYQPQGYVTQTVSNHTLPTINASHRRMQISMAQVARVPAEEQATVITSTSVANRSNYGHPSEHDGHDPNA